MLAYMGRRLLYALQTFIGITIATFALIHSAPGDPGQYYAGRGAITSMNAPAMAALRHEFHLDESLPRQYGYWLKGVLTLDLGRSVSTRQRITQLIADKLPRTLLLNVIAFVIAAAIGIPVGLWSASRSGHLFDRGSAISFFLLYSLPTFWVALLLMEFFSVKLGVLPLFGVTSDGYADMTGGGQVLDRIRRHALRSVQDECSPVRFNRAPAVRGHCARSSPCARRSLPARSLPRRARSSTAARRR
jgi:peptide/nickel transport system permease protein